MSSRPTPEQVKAEADLLEKMKPNVRKITAFGDNNHEAIEAQIRVFRDGLGDDDIYDLLDDGELTPYDVDSAIDAFYWAQGESGVEAPSDSWKSLLNN